MNRGPTEIYGVLETVKMDIHNGVIKQIKEQGEI